MDKQPWFEANPELFREVVEDTLRHFPDMRFTQRSGKAFLEGPFRLLYQDREIDRFELEVELPFDFPEGVPGVREVIGRIERKEDHHCREDGLLCLFVPGERWMYWPKGSTLADFMSGPVRSFLIGYLDFQATGSWPFSQRGHRAEGIKEAYSEMWATKNIQDVKAGLMVLAHVPPSWRSPCSCGSGQRFGKCHGEFYKAWIQRISPPEAQEALVNLTAKNGRKDLDLTDRFQVKGRPIPGNFRAKQRFRA